MQILIPLDGSRVAESALVHGRALVQAFGGGCVLLRVVPTDPVQPGAVTSLLDWQLRRRQAERYLSEVCSHFDTTGHEVVTAVEEGRVDEEILRYAGNHGIDLVILADSGGGASGPGCLGGTAGKIIAGLDASVLLVPQRDPQATAETATYQTVLAPVDGSPGSGWAARVAAGIAMASGANLLLVRVVRAPELPRPAGYSRETRRLAERLTQTARVAAGHWLRLLRSQLPPQLPVETQVIVAPSVDRVIRELSEVRRVDLMVLSAHGFDHEMDCRYGSVTERLLMHATRPILILQHDTAAAAGETGPTEESGRWRMPSMA